MASKPGFFKVLVGDFSKRLQIPPAFAKFFYQSPLPLKIRLQNSEKIHWEWQVNVVEIDNKLFFKKGWKDFVKDNLLEIGDFLVFSYVERSLFRFTIFESNGCVKDVTGKGKKKQSETMEKTIHTNEERHGNVSDKNAGLKTKEKPAEDDISVEFVGEVSNLGEKRKRRSKESKRDESTARNCKRGKVKKLADKEKKLVLERAKRAFKSDHPFFMVAIQPSYIGVGQNSNVNVPLEFVERYFNDKYRNVTLEIPCSKKTWHVKYYVSKRNNTQCKLNTGWLDFAIENHLAVGDVCAFELINASENICRVHIFRD